MTSPATIARAAAVHCEVKKHAYRQSQDGFVISFILHPQEVPEELATAGLGTRYVMALSQIGDDEQPVSPQRSHANTSSSVDATPRPVRPGGLLPAGDEKERQKFSDMPPAKQFGILCKEPAFHVFLRERFADTWAFAIKETYAGNEANTPESIARKAVCAICGVQRRRDIKPENTEARSLVLAYRLWIREPEVVPA